MPSLSARRVSGWVDAMQCEQAGASPRPLASCFRLRVCVPLGKVAIRNECTISSFKITPDHSTHQLLVPGSPRPPGIPLVALRVHCRHPAIQAKVARRSESIPLLSVKNNSRPFDLSFIHLKRFSSESPHRSLPWPAVRTR